MSVDKSYIPLSNVVPVLREIKDTMQAERALRTIKADDKRRKGTRYTDGALSDACVLSCSVIQADVVEQTPRFFPAE